jgi:hypothetical protein
VHVVFVGYGEDDKDFEGVNVKGKAILFLNGSPSANITTAAKLSRLKEKGAYSPYATARYCKRMKVYVILSTAPTVQTPCLLSLFQKMWPTFWLLQITHP